MAMQKLISFVFTLAAFKCKNNIKNENYGWQAKIHVESEYDFQFLENRRICQM